MLYKGIVQKGGAYGHTLGFPTANIVLHDATLSGIFAAEVVVDEKRYHAAAYADTKRKMLEVHLLDFDGDLYGKEVSIELKEKIRDDTRFATTEEAKQTIAADVQSVREYFTIP